MEESTRASSRKARVYVFRDFLVETYGSYLDAGSVVLDAAGGKGDLSWLLRNVDDIDAVVVDPRITKAHITKSVKYLRAHPEIAQTRSMPGLPSYQPLASLLPKLEGKDSFVAPRHLRILMTDDLVSAVQQRRGTANDDDTRIRNWGRFWSTAQQLGMEAQPLGYSEQHHTSPNQIESAELAWETISNAKLIVGFHPDQATDPALDLAMILGIPFCIVPCCVFPSEFPDRRLPSGSVKSYSELIEYIQRKSPNIATAKLPFHFSETSKNIALYTLPPTEL